MNATLIVLLGLLLSQLYRQSESYAPGRHPHIRTQVDLVLADALVARPKAGDVVGNLAREDFLIYEDGLQQQITHFSQHSLPLSLLFLVDRGGCVNPFGPKVRAAAREALARLKPEDEVALMTFSKLTQLVSGFGEERNRLVEALDSLDDHEEEGAHCFNQALYQAANYMRRAGNPDGRRVIILITGLTTNFDGSGLSAREVRQALLESGSVVCGLVPRTPIQVFESGTVGIATGVSRLFKVPTYSLKQLAQETGGEVFSATPSNIERAFHQLIDRLRTRYTLGFVSSNTKRDGSFRKIKLALSPAVQKREGKLIVRTRRGYLAPRAALH